MGSEVFMNIRQAWLKPDLMGPKSLGQPTGVLTYLLSKITREMATEAS